MQFNQKAGKEIVFFLLFRFAFTIMKYGFLNIQDSLKEWEVYFFKKTWRSLKISILKSEENNTC